MEKKKTSFSDKEQQIGTTFGPSKKVQITQAMIDAFAGATLDADPMHIDPEWSKVHSPYPSTIAFGFLTMSLLTTFAHDLLDYDREGRIGGKGFPLNYGFNKLRLLSPVPVNSNVSAKLKLLNCEERKSGQSLLTYEVIINIDGHSKPAMIGEWLALWVDNASDVA